MSASLGKIAFEHRDREHRPDQVVRHTFASLLLQQASRRSTSSTSLVTRRSNPRSTRLKNGSKWGTRPRCTGWTTGMVAKLTPAGDAAVEELVGV